MYQLCDHPAAPFTTLAGDTKGPCVNTGVPTVNGAPVYVGQQETRSIMKAFGWPAPEMHEAVVAERDAVVARADELQAKLADALDQLAAFEVIVKMHDRTAAPALD